MRIVDEPRRLPAFVQISRISSNVDADSIHIQIDDAASGTRVCKLRLSLDDFACAVTGLGVGCEMEWYGGRLVGKKHQVKSEVLPRYEGDRNDTAALHAHVAPHEVDGWTADINDLTNSHRWVTDGVSVTFHRWVDVSLEGGDDHD